MVDGAGFTAATNERANAPLGYRGVACVTVRNNRAFPALALNRMIDYQLDLPRRIATTRVTGPLTFAEVANHIHRLLRDRAFQPDFDAIIVAMDLDAVPPPSAIGALAPLVRAWSSRRRGARWAFVLPTPEARAFAEKALAEARLPGVAVRCFGAEPEAAAWLKAPSVAPVAHGQCA